SLLTLKTVGKAIPSCLMQEVLKSERYVRCLWDLAPNLVPEIERVTRVLSHKSFLMLMSSWITFGSSPLVPCEGPTRNAHMEFISYLTTSPSRTLVDIPKLQLDASSLTSVRPTRTDAGAKIYCAKYLLHLDPIEGGSTD
ncbi:MAG: hypothetical protein JRN20_08720, partial [Nitrososphaerota archaeon]|nr:hypothetical protein [Nitrososphaerota archaeon]